MKKNKGKTDKNFFQLLSLASFAISLVLVAVFMKASNFETKKAETIFGNNLSMTKTTILSDSGDTQTDRQINYNNRGVNKSKTVGAAEGILLIAAVVMGILGAIIYLGTKLKWRY